MGGRIPTLGGFTTAIRLTHLRRGQHPSLHLRASPNLYPAIKIFQSLILIGLLASSLACERLDVSPATSAQSPDVQASGNMSLADLAQSMDNPSDIDFFQKTDITDHAERGASEFAAKIAGGESYAAKPKIKFLWHGTDPNSSGCKKPKGLCLIINLLTVANPDFVGVEAKADLRDELLYVYFPAGVASDFGLTSDGYLPVAVDLPIPDDVLLDLGITHRHTSIKAGIYSASYIASEGRYVGVVVDLIKK